MLPAHKTLRPASALAAALLVALVAAAPAAAAGGGLQIFPDGTKLLFLVALFLTLIPVLDRLLFRPLLRVLDEREERTRGARKRAAELAQEADALLTRCETALGEARVQADGERKARVAAARREHADAVVAARSAAERLLASTREEVAASVEAARAALRADAEGLARDVAERLLGRRLS